MKDTVFRLLPLRSMVGGVVSLEAAAAAGDVMGIRPPSLSFCSEEMAWPSKRRPEKSQEVSNDDNTIPNTNIELWKIIVSFKILFQYS